MKVNSVVCFYFVALDASLGFHFLLGVGYVNPAYGCQIEINCMYIYSGMTDSVAGQSSTSVDRSETPSKCSTRADAKYNETPKQ